MTRGGEGSDFASLQELRGRIAALIDLKKYGKVIEEAQRSLVEEPEDAELTRVLAWALWQQGDMAAAEETGRKALALDPDSADAHSTLALILMQMEQYEQAREHHERAVALAPTSAVFHLRLGGWFFHAHEWRAALEKAEDALRFDPMHVEALELKAAALRQLGHLDQAEAAIEEALSIAPQHAGAYYRLAHVHSRRGEVQGTIDSLREAARLDPENKLYRESLARTRLMAVPGLRFLWKLGTNRTWLAVFTSAGSVLSMLICWAAIAAVEPRLRYLALACLCLFPMSLLLVLDILARVVRFAVARGWMGR